VSGRVASQKKKRKFKRVPLRHYKFTGRGKQWEDATTTSRLIGVSSTEMFSRAKGGEAKREKYGEVQGYRKIVGSPFVNIGDKQGLPGEPRRCEKITGRGGSSPRKTKRLCRGKSQLKNRQLESNGVIKLV